MEFNDEEQGLSKLNNPWSKVKIPRSDVPEKRAIPASKLRAFFNVVPDRSRFTNPLMEVGQDVATTSSRRNTLMKIIVSMIFAYL